MLLLLRFAKREYSFYVLPVFAHSVLYRLTLFDFVWSEHSIVFLARDRSLFSFSSPLLSVFVCFIEFFSPRSRKPICKSNSVLSAILFYFFWNHHVSGVGSCQPKMAKMCAKAQLAYPPYAQISIGYNRLKICL
jgi:hypothetical protein